MLSPTLRGCDFQGWRDISLKKYTQGKENLKKNKVVFNVECQMS